MATFDCDLFSIAKISFIFLLIYGLGTLMHYVQNANL